MDDGLEKADHLRVKILAVKLRLTGNPDACRASIEMDRAHPHYELARSLWWVRLTEKNLADGEYG